MAPDFARTAYSMQGQTLDAAIVDLNFDKRTSPVTAYVALSRVRSASHVLITHKFKLSTFQQGVSPEADILLRYLGGDSVMEDIAAREAAKVAEREARAAATKEARRRAGEDSGRKARKVVPKKSTIKNGVSKDKLTKDLKKSDKRKQKDARQFNKLPAEHELTKEAKERKHPRKKKDARQFNKLPAEHELTKEAKERKHPRKRIQCPSCRIHKEAPEWANMGVITASRSRNWAAANKGIGEVCRECRDKRAGGTH